MSVCLGCILGSTRLRLSFACGGVGGDVAASVADVGALEQHVRPADLAQYQADIAAAPMLVVDANLAPDTLQVRCMLEFN